MAPVPGCRNTLKYPSGGAILMHRGEELVSVDCPNMRVISLRQRLLGIDPQLLKVRHYASTPLYQTTGGVDRTTDDLFIRQVNWRTFLGHFKWVIGSKKPGFFVRIVTDMTLLNVYLGKASVKNRLASQRSEDGELLISNSLEDLLSSPDLVVIRLGHVIYANRAAADVLREAISLRLGLGKATWLVEPPDQTFAPLNMASCDDNVVRLVESAFEEMHLFAFEAVEPGYYEDEDGVTVPGPEDTAPEDTAAEDATAEGPESDESEASDDGEPKTAARGWVPTIDTPKSKSRYQKSKNRR
jgi:PAS domain-containing protein